MATTVIKIDTGNTINLAAVTVSEDAVTKYVGRSVINNTGGIELGTLTTPFIVVVTNTGGTVLVSNTNQSVLVSNTVQTVAISGTSSVISANTGIYGTVILSNTAIGGQVLVTNTGGVIAVSNTAGWVVSVSNTAQTVTLSNTGVYGTVVQSNTARTVIVVGTATVGGTVLLGGSGSVMVANSLGVTLSSTALQAIISHGKTCKVVSGTVSASGNAFLVGATASKRLKVYAYSFITASTSQNMLLLCDGTDTTKILYNGILQAVTGTVMGANLATSIPTYFFATTAGTGLGINTSAAGVISYMVSYWDDDTT